MAIRGKTIRPFLNDGLPIISNSKHNQVEQARSFYIDFFIVFLFLKNVETFFCLSQPNGSTSILVSPHRVFSLFSIIIVQKLFCSCTYLSRGQKIFFEELYRLRLYSVHNLSMFFKKWAIYVLSFLFIIDFSAAYRKYIHYKI